MYRNMTKWHLQRWVVGLRHLIQYLTQVAVTLLTTGPCDIESCKTFTYSSSYLIAPPPVAHHYINIFRIDTNVSGPCQLGLKSRLNIIPQPNLLMLWKTTNIGSWQEAKVDWCKQQETQPTNQIIYLQTKSDNQDTWPWKTEALAYLTTLPPYIIFAKFLF